MGVVRGASCRRHAHGVTHADQDLGPAHLARGAVDDLERVARIVHEGALAGEVMLAHGRGEPALPSPIELAEPVVPVAVVWMGDAVRRAHRRADRRRRAATRGSGRADHRLPDHDPDPTARRPRCLATQGGTGPAVPVRPRAPSARTISAMRTAGVSPSRCTVTSPTAIRMSATGAPSGTSRTTSGANMASSVPGSGAGRTSAPSFAFRRQTVSWFGWMAYRAATALTVAPGRKLSATICAFTSSGQRRWPESDLHAQRSEKRSLGTHCETHSLQHDRDHLASTGLWRKVGTSSRLQLTGANTVCPMGGVRSGPRHGRCVRALADLPAHGRAVRVRLSGRRSRCMATRCPTKTFSDEFSFPRTSSRSSNRAFPGPRCLPWSCHGRSPD